MRAAGRSIAVAALAVSTVVAPLASFDAADAFAAGPLTVSTLVGGGSTQSFTGPAAGVSMYAPMGVATDSNGTPYAANSGDNVVGSVANGTATTIIGSYAASGESGDGGPAAAASLYDPTGLAHDSTGDLFIDDSGDQVIREVTPDGNVKLVAGTGGEGYTGDGGLAVQATFNNPQGVAVDGKGDVYVADTGNNAIREIAPDGKISTFAGDGTPGFRGDTGPATKAELTQPTGVAVDALGNVYIADAGNNVIRRVSTAGAITTVAGNYVADQAKDGKGGFSGDGGPATVAQLHSPQGVYLDQAGDLFIADTFNNAIREVTPGGTISTIVNTARVKGNTDGAAATAALNTPEAVAFDNSTGNLYIADTSNRRIRELTGLAPPTATAGGPVAPSPGPPPQTPEAPLAVAVPLVGVGVIGGALLLLRRRQARSPIV